MHLRLRLACLFALLLAALPAPAQAEVRASWHSFNGSVLFGRYPHAFVVFEGTLDETGERIEENFGFSAKSAGPAVLTGPVRHIIMTEEAKWITRTNRHFTIALTDEQYHRLRREVFAWRDHPGKYYDLDTRNCIHFVGRLATAGGPHGRLPQGHASPSQGLAQPCQRTQSATPCGADRLKHCR